MKKSVLAEMTNEEFATALRDNPVVLLPLGSQECQGPHAPMGDFMIANRVATEAAAEAGAICAPVLPFGYANFFRGMPGGIQLRAETFRAVLRDMIDAFTAHGVERLIICNGHTTNASLIADVTDAVRSDTGIVVPSLNLWRAMPDTVWQRLHGENAAAARGHGADPLTSLYLHLMPDLVAMDRATHAARGSFLGHAAQPNVTSIVFEGGMVDLPLDISEVAPNGIAGGDPQLASAEIGREIYDWTVNWVAKFIDHFRDCDPRAVALRPVPGPRHVSADI